MKRRIGEKKGLKTRSMVAKKVDRDRRASVPAHFVRHRILPGLLLTSL